jgi:hypothetical protein
VLGKWGLELSSGLAVKTSISHCSGAGMVKPKIDFERAARVPLSVHREQQARETPVAMADYIRARQTLLERMLALRAARLKQLAGDE